MQLARIVLQWSGAPVVGGGVTVLHFAGDAGTPDPAAIKGAFQAIAAGMPSSVSITVPDSGDVIEDTTGELVNVWSSTGGGTFTGTNVGNVAAGVGACITWLTGGIINGKRLRGRTFIVPLSNNSYGTDGTLEPSMLANLETLASGLQASGPLAVWHRPTSAGASDGNSYGVVSHRIRDKVAILTSRRD